MTSSVLADRPNAPLGYLELLKENRPFRLLWFGEVVSFAGDWFNSIALYAAVNELSGSTEAIAAIFVAKLLPVFLMTPIAGPLCDRFDRRRLMRLTDVARAICALGLIGAYRLKSLPLLLGILVVMVVFSGLFIPAKTAAVPQLTTERQLNAANALSAGTWSIMLAIGAAAGGVVTEFGGIETAMLCDSLTFVVSGAFIYALPALRPSDRRDDVVSEGDDASNQRGFFDGLRYLAQRRYLLVLIGLKPGMVLAGGIIAMLPVVATELGGDSPPSLTMGALYTARGLGAMVGSLVIRKIFGDRVTTMRHLIVVGYILVSMGYGVIAAADTLTLAGVGYFVAALGGGGVWVFSGTLAQLQSDDAFRGRVFAIEWGVLTLLLSGAAWGAGAVIERAGWSLSDVATFSSAIVWLPLSVWVWVLVSGMGTRQTSDDAVSSLR